MSGKGNNVGTAYITIMPSMEGAQQSIQSQLSDVMGKAGTEASEKAGTSFMAGFGGKLGKLGGVVSKLLPVAGIAATAGAAGKALFGIGEEFDSMTDSIIIGTGASGKALEELKGSAMDMATSVPMSFGEAGDIVQDLNTRLGLTGDNLTKVGTQIAQVGNMTGEAFDVEKFSGAMTAFGVGADEMSSKMDTLFAISQSTGIGMNDLTGIVETSAPTMQALGYSFEETASMAGLLDKAGLDASGTMSKMSKALTTMAKDGEDPAETLKRTTDEIGNLLAKGDEAGAIDMASKLFGTKGATQFVAAVQSGTMNIDEFSAAMTNSDGIINETNERTMDFAERVEILKNQFKELLEPMGSAVFSGLSTVMEKASTAFSKFTHGPGKQIQKTFGKIVEFGKKVGKIFVEAFKNQSGAKNMSSVLKTVSNAIKTVSRVLSPLLSAFGQLLKKIVPPLAKALGSTLGKAFKTVGNIVKTIGKVINSFIDIMKKAKEGFDTFKNKVTAPFRFLGGLKKPKIDISGGKIPFGIGGEGVKPHISVTWGAKGGIIDGIQFIGAGEAGREALLPLDRNTGWMDDLADKINGHGGTFNINLTANAQENPEQFAQRTIREMHRLVRMGAI